MERKKESKELYSAFNKGVVFYEVGGAYLEKYSHLKYCCVRSFSTIGYGGKKTVSTMITFGNKELISFTPNIRFCKTNVERYLLTLFKQIEQKQ